MYPTVNARVSLTSVRLRVGTQGSTDGGCTGVRKFLGRKMCEAKQRRRIIIAVPVGALKEKRIASV